jgi:hypothetical protein
MTNTVKKFGPGPRLQSLPFRSDLKKADAGVYDVPVNYKGSMVRLSLIEKIRTHGLLQLW